jgi:hypothetical protein
MAEPSADAKRQLAKIHDSILSETDSFCNSRHVSSHLFVIPFQLSSATLKSIFIIIIFFSFIFFYFSWLLLLYLLVILLLSTGVFIFDVVRLISGEIFNLRTSARGKCTGVPARACRAAAAKSLVGFCYFLFAWDRDNGHGDATIFGAKAMPFDMEQP